MDEDGSVRSCRSASRGASPHSYSQHDSNPLASRCAGAARRPGCGCRTTRPPHHRRHHSTLFRRPGAAGRVAPIAESCRQLSKKWRGAALLIFAPPGAREHYGLGPIRRMDRVGICVPAGQRLMATAPLPSCPAEADRRCPASADGCQYRAGWQSRPTAILSLWLTLPPHCGRRPSLPRGATSR